MTDIILEISRAFIVGVIFIYLLLAGKKEEIRRQKGWSFILAGFAFLLFGMIIDITDNFESLNRFVIIGDTEYQAYLEKVAGYLCGFLLLAVGFWKWMPTVIALSQTEKTLKKSHDKLEQRVESEVGKGSTFHFIAGFGIIPESVKQEHTEEIVNFENDQLFL